MLEEKWYNPKSYEQLIKEDKEKQFKQWVKDKCEQIVLYVSCGNCEYVSHIEQDGSMAIRCRTKENFKSCCFYETYMVDINDFWDKDDPQEMNIKK